ncbi:hypothetical protein ACFL34_01865 [Candidatus Sumerlaeota bacterium]
MIGLAPDIDMHELLCGPWWAKGDDFVRMVRNDKFMANVLSDEVLDRKEKALVQVGNMHSFTHYRQPAVKNGKLVAEAAPRLGHILYQKYSDRVCQVALHQWDFMPDWGPRQPFGGLLENIFAANGNQPVGFDVVDSPFALLRDGKSYYFAHQKYVTFADVARGYVFLKPLAELNKITWINGFITKDNFEQVRGLALKKGLIKESEGKTPQELDDAMARIAETN